MNRILRHIILLAAALILGGGYGMAQSLKQHITNAENEAYASIVKPDLSRHLKPIELRILDSRADDDAENMQLADDLLSYARTFLGTRYRRGGKTPAGFDCSGFTGYVFRQFGFSLNSSSAAQYSNGVEVADSDVRPGDLLFFKGRASKSARIGHVGIAIDCDPETGVITFIHASCTGGISIDRTSAPYYSKRYVGARRVIGQ